ncbi:MAG: hypothetical protein RJA70_3551 [Pseudomonadota bacterium]|jgi:hypothetical protein
MTSLARPPIPGDPELLELPVPRRPWRRATLLSLTLTATTSVTLCIQLLPEATYAAGDGQPVELADLAKWVPDPTLENRFVHASGSLAPEAVGYRRPLDSDRFRLAPLVGNPRIWVELREPAGSLGEHFVAPESFIGRLVPFSAPGLRHGWVRGALATSGQETPEPADWLLLDGESPSSNRWVFGLMGLLAAFAGFSVFGIGRLLTKIRSA